MNLRTALTRLALSTALLSPAAALAAPDQPSAPPPVAQPGKAEAQQSRPVDLVICLDSSGSMQGLIDSARQKIWDICTQLAQARPAPKLRVALISFGGNANPSGGYVVVEKALTDELDQVYERLFALQPTGSTELVGRALHEALTQLQWSDDPGALKMIFVAGNESADQDRQYDVREQVKKALQHSVVVNSLFCGPDAPAGDPVGWREVAQLGGGEFAAIDQNGVVAIATPFDAEITRLGTEINATYLAFGRRGRAMAANQSAQDTNAGSAGITTLASRMQLKGDARLYCNSSWDLVDACREKDFDWSKLKDEELPEVLRGKTQEECEAYVKSLQEKRAGIQAKIQELGKQRTDFIQAELAKRAKEHGKSLDFAIAKAVRKAAEAKGFTFE